METGEKPTSQLIPKSLSNCPTVVIILTELYVLNGHRLDRQRSKDSLAFVMCTGPSKLLKSVSPPSHGFFG